MGVRVACIGLSPTTHNEAFDHDYDELWGLPWDAGYWRHYDRLFEMHDLKLLESNYSKRDKDYLQELQETPQTLYMQEKYFPNVTKYPIEQTNQYLNSSIAYMIALAISEGVEEIGVFGVDMKGDDEYGYQKPNIEYLLGLAEGKGIKVTIPEKSPLLKFNSNGIWFYDHLPTYYKRYGLLDEHRDI